MIEGMKSTWLNDKEVEKMFEVAIGHLLSSKATPVGAAFSWEDIAKLAKEVMSARSIVKELTRDVRAADFDSLQECYGNGRAWVKIWAGTTNKKEG